MTTLREAVDDVRRQYEEATGPLVAAAASIIDRANLGLVGELKERVAKLERALEVANAEVERVGRRYTQALNERDDLLEERERLSLAGGLTSADAYVTSQKDEVARRAALTTQLACAAKLERELARRRRIVRGPDEAVGALMAVIEDIREGRLLEPPGEDR